MKLITGANGYVGRHLVARLVAQGERPRCLVRQNANVADLPKDKIELVYGDVTKPETLPSALAGITEVIHLAALTANIKQKPGATYEIVNVEGVKNLVKAAEESGVKHIVQLSGILYPPIPPGSWMDTRARGEEVLRQSKTSWSILQPSILFGTGGDFFRANANVLLKAPVMAMVIGNGKDKFQPIWVEDVVTCLLKMADQASPEGAKYKEQSIKVGGPEIMTYDELIDLMINTLGISRAKVHVPVSLMKPQAALMEALLAKPPITTSTLSLFGFPNNTTEDAVSKNFGFTPRSLRDYLKESGKAGLL